MEITVPFSSYKFMRLFAVLGGLLGILQSLLWIGACVTAVLGYYCSISFDGVAANYGTILQLTLYQMYFRGNCTPTGFPNVDFTAIEDLDLLTPSTVNIWMWVFLSLHFVWLISSLTLIINVKKSNLRYSNVFLYLWVLITIVISIIDLVLFVLFVIDYDTVYNHSLTTNVNFAVSTSSILITAQNSAGIMMSAALRGYLLWFINLAIAFYLFTQTFKVYDYNKLSVKGGDGNQVHVNQAFKNDSQLTINNEPIKAFNSSNNAWYNYLTTDIPRAKRPVTMTRSASVNGLEESFQKRMTVVDTNGHRHSQGAEVILRRDQNTQSAQSNRNSGIGNYTQNPPPSNFESRPPLKGGILRNSRYQ